MFLKYIYIYKEKKSTKLQKKSNGLGSKKSQNALNPQNNPTTKISRKSSSNRPELLPQAHTHRKREPPRLP